MTTTKIDAGKLRLKSVGLGSILADNTSRALGWQGIYLCFVTLGTGQSSFVRSDHRKR